MNKQNFYYGLFLSLPIVYFLSLPISTGDLAVWVAHGKYFLIHGEVLRHDIYSVLKTNELIYPFGSCLLYALFYSIGGLIAVSLFHKVIILIISIIWYHGSLQKLKSPWSYTSLFIILLAWFGTSFFYVERPALLGMLPMLLTYLVLKKEENLKLKDFFILNLINIVWVNIHGSWILLIAMYGWRELGRIILFKKNLKWQQAVAILSFFITSLINPFGYKVFPYLLQTTSISLERRIDEWAQPSLSGAYQDQAFTYYLLFILIVGFAFFLYKNNEKERLKRMAISPFILILLMGLISIRNTALAFFIFIPFACEFILTNGKKENFDEKKNFANIIFLTAVLLIGIAFLPTVKPHLQNYLPETKKAVYDNSAPIALAQILNETRDNDPVFNDWEYGSFLILAQKHPIFIDTRNIIYGRDEFQEYKNIMMAKLGWENRLQNYNIRYILISKNLRKNLIVEAEKSMNWIKLKEESGAVLYQRKE